MNDELTMIEELQHRIGTLERARDLLQAHNSRLNSEVYELRHPKRPYMSELPEQLRGFLRGEYKDRQCIAEAANEIEQLRGTLNIRYQGGHELRRWMARAQTYRTKAQNRRKALRQLQRAYTAQLRVYELLSARLVIHGLTKPDDALGQRRREALDRLVEENAKLGLES